MKFGFLISVGAFLFVSPVYADVNKLLETVCDTSIEGVNTSFAPEQVAGVWDATTFKRFIHRKKKILVLGKTPNPLLADKSQWNIVYQKKEADLFTQLQFTYGAGKAIGHPVHYDSLVKNINVSKTRKSSDLDAWRDFSVAQKAKEPLKWCRDFEAPGGDLVCEAKHADLANITHCKRQSVPDTNVTCFFGKETVKNYHINVEVEKSISEPVPSQCKYLFKTFYNPETSEIVTSETIIQRVDLE